MKYKYSIDNVAKFQPDPSLNKYVIGKSILSQFAAPPCIYYIFMILAKHNGVYLGIALNVTLKGFSIGKINNDLELY